MWILNRNLYQAEYKCHGPGSEIKDRAPWTKQLNDKEVAPFLSIDFINGSEWLPVWLWSLSVNHIWFSLGFLYWFYRYNFLFQTSAIWLIEALDNQAKLLEFYKLYARMLVQDHSVIRSVNNIINFVIPMNFLWHAIWLNENAFFSLDLVHTNNFCKNRTDGSPQ